MPINLINATKDLRDRDPDDPKAIDQETSRARIEARSKYALAPKGKPSAEGKQRYMCPATAGRLQCPLKPTSLGTDPRLRLVDPVPSPVGPPKICEQTAITTTLEDGAKHWQPRAYGSPEWQKIYGRLRNAVEGMNGYAKTDAHESSTPATAASAASPPRPFCWPSNSPTPTNARSTPGSPRSQAPTGVHTEEPATKNPNRSAPGPRQATSTHPWPEQPINNAPQRQKTD
jgi:hypothetical protein